MSPADLNDIFVRLRELLSRYSPPLAVRTGSVAGKDDLLYRERGWF